VKERTKRLLGIKGKRSVDHFHRELGRIMWGLLRHGPQRAQPPAGAGADPAVCARSFGRTSMSREGEALNVSLEKAGRVADFLEFGELLCLDAFERRESCGRPFSRGNSSIRTAKQNADDEHFQHVAAWNSPGKHEARPPY